ncbi:MAG: hypothetical protein JNJ48_07600 [Phycisphaerae bacterium]|nr:hypothetical protein [Phycisphaerae bacterium]
MAPLLLAVSSEEVIPAVAAITFGCLVAITALIVNGVRRASETRHREQSRREIAAYVAEGSMTPEQGERLMNAGQPPAQEKRR